MESEVLPCIPADFLYDLDWLESLAYEVGKQLIRVETTIYSDIGHIDQRKLVDVIQIVINHEFLNEGEMVDDYKVYRLSPTSIDPDLVVEHTHPVNGKEHICHLVLDDQSDYQPNNTITWALQQNPNTEESSWVLEFYDLHTHEYMSVEGALKDLIPTVTQPSPEEDHIQIQQHLYHRFGWGLETDLLYLPIANLPIGNWYHLPEVSDTKSTMGYYLGGVFLTDKNQILSDDVYKDLLVGIPLDNKIVITGESRVRNELESLIRTLLDTNRNLHIQGRLEIRFGDIYDELHTLMGVQIEDVDDPTMMVGTVWFEPSTADTGFDLRFSMSVGYVPTKYQPFTGCLISPKDILYPLSYTAVQMESNVILEHPWKQGIVQIMSEGDIHLKSKDLEYISGV